MKKIVAILSIGIFLFSCGEQKGFVPLDNTGDLTVTTTAGFEFDPTNIFFMDGIGATDLASVQNAIMRANNFVSAYNNDAAHTKKYKIVDFDVQHIQRGSRDSMAIIKVRVELIAPALP